MTSKEFDVRFFDQTLGAPPCRPCPPSLSPLTPPNTDHSSGFCPPRPSLRRGRGGVLVVWELPENEIPRRLASVPRRAPAPRSTAPRRGSAPEFQQPSSVRVAVPDAFPGCPRPYVHLPFPSLIKTPTAEGAGGAARRSMGQWGCARSWGRVPQPRECPSFRSVCGSPRRELRRVTAEPRPCGLCGY